MWEKHFRTFLASKLEEARSRNAAISLRSFARKIQVAPGMLSEILNERRKVSAGTARKILDLLDLSPSERARLEQLISGAPAQTRVLLPQEAYELASRWYYPAILCLFDLDQPPADAADISRRLGLDPALTAQAVEKLLGFGFLKRDERGALASARGHFTTTEDVPNSAFQQGLAESLERAAEALESVTPARREVTSVTFDGTADRLLLGKEEIRKFRGQMVSVMQGVKRDAVYCLNIQLIPLSGGEDA